MRKSGGCRMGGARRGACGWFESWGFRRVRGVQGVLCDRGVRVSGVSGLSGTKTKSERIQHAGHPCGKHTGGGGSKTPTASHRRPLPFRKRLCGRTLWPEACQAIGPCVPRVGLESVRGTRWGRRTGRRGRKKEKGGGGLLGASWGTLGACWELPGGSWRPLWGLLGPAGSFLGAYWWPLWPS